MSAHAVMAEAENWFVAQLKPNGLTLAERNLARQGFAHFAPRRRETSLRGGIRSVSSKPLFPGYIFVQFDPRRPGWTAINATRGITRLLLNDLRNPRGLPGQFMAGLRARCDDGQMLESSDLSAGDRIRVISGPFAEIVSTVEQLGKDQRIGLLIDLMGQKVRVKLPAHSVEKLTG
ncbi:transcription termination/antitermination protein NusG [Sulfitobacter aestuarii]|uniref:Transcription termination/antitermination protein NusG n=1 Tax=Sulfitobacter aestuarii TaxID=2161676 RepID=A0ABW5U4F3_9RHOB